MAGPLAGIRIIDWTIWQHGPVSTAMLGDMGAEVIHVEHPVDGDPARGAMRYGGVLATVPGGRNYYFETNNRNKKSMTLDLAHPRAKAVMHKLVAKSDVFVQNMRIGVAERLGMDYESLKPRNPKLIYARPSAYGPQGPDRTLPALDLVAQARSGLMYTIGEPNTTPVSVAPGIADQMGAIMLAYGVALALVARERFGVGQQVDTSLLGSMLFLQGLNVGASLFLGIEMRKHDRVNPGNPLWNWYRCQDGEWVCMAAPYEKNWPAFCKALGIEHLVADPRCDTLDKRKENRELTGLIEGIFTTKTRAEWLRILRAADVISDQVQHIGELAADEQVKANVYIQDFDHPVFGPIKAVGIPVTLSETPGALREPAPEFGQHTEEVLIDICGLSWEEVVSLREEGVV